MENCARFDTMNRKISFDKRLIRHCHTPRALAECMPEKRLLHLLQTIQLIQKDTRQHNKTFYLIVYIRHRECTIAIAPLQKGRKLTNNDYIRPYNIIFEKYLRLTKRHRLGKFSDIEYNKDMYTSYKYELEELDGLKEEWSMIYYKKPLITMRYIRENNNVWFMYPMELIELIIRNTL